ncbi:aminotransferase class I/II-fold pyridoxal phosphate-dependent enzyme [Granulicella sp. WH15]|uniref:trans-sulfuration enzyme family protein n=1 Tax=Granulicella sp. WH15 TaxID=2602070 RepID=UPI001366D9CA|nr:PLP-dependent aspartate aminotransferase family protein [Granulicella sp. WH15]QHN04201.1 aminotransferase class I/II-fold pyridoxal phosphate-dependent enzyme [Granulicella sp. WH15]
MSVKPHVHPETLAVHAGQPVDPVTGAVVSPIYLATTFERDTDGSFPRGYSYSRSNNPNRQALETCLAALEGADQAIAFSSGLGAAGAVVESLAHGDHVVVTDDVYHGFRKLLEHRKSRGLLDVTLVDPSDISNIEAAIRPDTKLLWLETPSNPLLRITDLEAVAKLARSRGIFTVCDSTLCSPILQKPLAYGIDIVMHSTTKYIAGHSDVTGGVLLCNGSNPLFEEARIAQQYGVGGGIPSPFDCWLTLRGVATLPLRMRAQSASALEVARFLEEQPQVEKVYYPGLPQHPQHEIAARQMKMFGGVLSFQLRGSEAEALAFTGRTKLFTRATSLGGTHSLIEHRASIEGAGTKTPDNLLRLSIGLENSLDLIEDLRGALQD